MNVTDCRGIGLGFQHLRIEELEDFSDRRVSERESFFIFANLSNFLVRSDQNVNSHLTL